MNNNDSPLPLNSMNCHLWQAPFVPLGLGSLELELWHNTPTTTSAWERVCLHVWYCVCLFVVMRLCQSADSIGALILQPWLKLKGLESWNLWKCEKNCSWTVIIVCNTQKLAACCAWFGRRLRVWCQTGEALDLDILSSSCQLLELLFRIKWWLLRVVHQQLETSTGIASLQRMIEGFTNTHK